MAGFCCPVCGMPLQDAGNRLVCVRRHSFDQAKSGYVHLLLHTAGGKNHGDNRLMVQARRQFLETGFYAPLRTAICETAGRFAVPGGTALDSGCGEGYYTEKIAETLSDSMQILGLDISKDAVNLAAKRCRQARLAVASAFQIPMQEKSVDLLFEIFSPFAEAEFMRVLKPGGYFIEVIPGARHLYGLKAAIYETPYENEVTAFSRNGYTLCACEHLQNEIFLDKPADIQNLFCMTPYYYKTGKAEQARLQTLKALTTETEFYILVYQKQ